MLFSRHQLRLFLDEQGIHLSKNRGQNFLLEPNIHQKLIKQANLDAKKDMVIEVGGGLGHLTQELARIGVPTIVFEIDRKLACVLKERFRDNARIQIMHLDFLKQPIHDLISDKSKRIKVIANVPYSISSLILEHCGRARSLIHSMFWIVQKEFALRLTANPGMKDYSALSVFVQSYFDVRCMFKVSRHVFFPVPDVESMAVSFRYLEQQAPPIEIEDCFRKILKSIFSSRRKTLYNSLVKSQFISMAPDLIKSVLEALNIPTNIRGELLNPKQIQSLATSLVKAMRLDNDTLNK